MKLNRKGYMLVEIVVASALAMSISYFLLSLTYRFKNTSQDLDFTYYLMNDKIAILKNIMNDLEEGSVIIINEINTVNSYIIDFNFFRNNTDIKEQRRLSILKKDNNTTLEYGKIDNGIFDYEDVSYYIKELNPTLIVDNIIKEEDENSITIILPIISNYDKEDYSIKLYLNKYK